jgi:hypothetical protein
MSDKNPPQNPPKLSDFEVELLILERDIAQYRLERLDELLNRIDAPKSYAETPKPVETMVKAKDAEALFSRDLADLLDFEEREDGVIIRPRKFLGSENFAKIAKIVKDNGGSYVSAGKDSHFCLTKHK